MKYLAASLQKSESLINTSRLCSEEPLFIAKGSSAEVRSMLYVGLELGYFSQEEFKKCYNLSVDISKLLSGLVKTL